MDIVAPIGFTLLTIFVVLVISVTYYRALLRIGIAVRQVFMRLILLLIAIGMWLTYLFYIGISGILWNFDMPPRFLLLVFLPLGLITTFLFIKNNKSQLYNTIPKRNVIYFQSFRIFVELMIHASFLAGIFPIEMTYEGYNFEIIVGLIAPIVAYFVYQRSWWSEKIVLIFNYIGLVTLAIIIFIVITSLYAPSFWGDTAPRITQDFTRVPYLLLPGFLAPMAIFAHIFSIIQIRKSRKVKGGVKM